MTIDTTKITPEKLAEMNDSLITDNNYLRGRVTELLADAERYRWLRDPYSGAERKIYYPRGDYGKGLMAGTMLDAAIDAAIAAARRPE